MSDLVCECGFRARSAAGLTMHRRWDRAWDETEQVVQNAMRSRRIVNLVLQMPGKNPAAVALGKLGGAKGGKARAAKLSPQERSAIARKAALARWSASR